MTDAPRLRDWRAKDIPAITGVEIASWRSAYGGIIEPSVLERLDFARIAIRWQRAFDQGMPVALAEIAGEVIGFASRSGGEITMLYVHPDYWRRGVGRALLQRMLAGIAASGETTAWLWVLADNQPGRRFYQALGGAPGELGKTRVGSRVLDQVRYVWTLSTCPEGGSPHLNGR